MRYKQHDSALPTFLVYPKRKSTKDSAADLYIQFCYEKGRIDKSLGLRIDYKQWDPINHKVKEHPLHNQILEQRTAEYKQKIMGAYYMLMKNGGEINIREIVDAAFERDGGKSYSLFGVFGEFILKMEKLTGKDQSKANLQKHKSCLKHLKDFVYSKYRSSDVTFSRINRQFIDDFELYLKTDGGNGHNSANKMLQIFKKVYRIAVDNRWTANNAFAGRRLTYKKVAKPYLTAEEIDALRSHEFASKRLTAVKDCFIFSCFTGLAYIDILTLKRRYIEFNNSSQQYFIRKNRAKTGVESIIPLFKPADDILETYCPGWKKCAPNTTLLPVISNQRYNSYLKEVAEICGIEKELTSHVARHSFATTITLENGVSIESVSKMLGHAKLSQTQEYAKVTELKIEKDTRVLMRLFNHK